MNTSTIVKLVATGGFILNSAKELLNSMHGEGIFQVDSEEMVGDKVELTTSQKEYQDFFLSPEYYFREYYDESGKPTKREGMGPDGMVSCETYEYNENGDLVGSYFKNEESGDYSTVMIYNSEEKDFYYSEEKPGYSVTKTYNPETGEVIDRVFRDAEGNIE